MQTPPPYQQQHQPAKKNNNVLWIVLGVVAVCGCGGVAVMGAILFPVFSQAKLAATKSRALSNMKQTSLALVIYTADNNDFLPVGTKWVDKTEAYIGNPGAFKSPALAKEHPEAYGFAFRKELSSKSTVQYEEINRWAMAFDSTILTRNACSGLETLPSPPRYGSGSTASNMVGFMDGHAKATRPSELAATAPDGKPAIR